MKELSITFIQTNLQWENPLKNRTYFSEKIQEITGKTDIIILPEMFTTGFSMNASKLAETMHGETLQWMISEAKQNNSAITGSVIISENGLYYNRLFFVYPDGTYKTYDKRHTFTLAGEDKIFTAGTKRLILEYKGWKICPLICYDLRFPVWARNTHEYDLLLYVANWPAKRINAWDALLKARAIENMTYCFGVNRVGFDANGHEYIGHSAAYDALGEQISTKDFEKELVTSIILNKNHLNEHRAHLQFLNDRDRFILE